MKNEIWRDIAGYKGWYQVSNMGRVRSVDRTVYFNSKSGKGSRFYKGQILKLKYHNGYQMVNLLQNNKLEVVYVHRLVLETFVPPVEGKTWCNHKNGIKSDNRVENLEWCTKEYNFEHAINTLGRDIRKLTYEQAEKIREDVLAGKYKSLRAIAREYGLSRDCIYDLLDNVTYKTATSKPINIFRKSYDGKIAK